MSRLQRTAAIVIVICVVLDAVLGLSAIYRHWFKSTPINEFMLIVWDAVSLWTGRAVTVVGVLVPLVVYAIRKRWPPKREWQDSVAALLAKLEAWRNQPRLIFPTALALVVLGVALGLCLLLNVSAYSLPASAVVLKPDGSEVYVIVEVGGSLPRKIVRFSTSTDKPALGAIDINGTPDRMLVGPRSGHLFVLDMQHATVTELDMIAGGSVVDVYTSKGRFATSFALTPDERKLYISNQQPSPNATITVIELREEKKSRRTHEIQGFNCPMGLGILPNGSKIYVASQCGAGQDPVFVIDTKKDVIVKTIPGFATGSEIAVAGEHPKIYVSRSGFDTLDASGRRKREPDRITPIEASSDAPIPDETIAGGGGSMTTSPDGKYLFYSTRDTIEIVNVATQKRNSLKTGASATGIAVGHTGSEHAALVLYAWLPEAHQLFFTGLSGLLP